MTECSAWCHDQARAINGNIPTADDLKNYIDCYEKFCKQNRPQHCSWLLGTFWVHEKLNCMNTTDKRIK